MNRILFNFKLAIDGVISNTLRAILTALGIVFGVGAVIAMLAIGNGAKQSILDQMKLIGTNNIVVNSVILKGGDEGEETANTEESNQGNGEDGKTPLVARANPQRHTGAEISAAQLLMRSAPKLCYPPTLCNPAKPARPKWWV